MIGTVEQQADDASGQAPFAPSTVEDYRLRPTDTLALTVYREPDLSLPNVTVGADGTIAVPLVGSVMAEGRTAAELAQAVEAALGRGYLVNPRVSVNVVRYESHLVTVEGAVKQAGVFTFAPGARLSAAIALAGGPLREAKLDQLAVFRRTPQGTAIAKFDYRAMQAGTMLDPVLLPGDRVVMGTSGLSQFWQDALRAIPVFALFTNI